jgi:hypothetical protein
MSEELFNNILTNSFTICDMEYLIDNGYLKVDALSRDGTHAIYYIEKEFIFHDHVYYPGESIKLDLAD